MQEVGYVYSKGVVRCCDVCSVWHLETGQCERTFKHKHAISAIALSAELCISGCDSGNVTVWDVKSGQIVKVGVKLLSLVG